MLRWNHSSCREQDNTSLPQIDEAACRGCVSTRSYPCFPQVVTDSAEVVNAGAIDYLENLGFRHFAYCGDMMPRFVGRA